MLNKRALQVAVLLASVVPIGAGLAGVFEGSLFLSDQLAPAAQDSHFRYLSGLLLAIGLAFASAVRRIERHGGLFLLLTGIVVTGGLARLAGLVFTGASSTSTLFALFMELLVTPAIFIWQRSVAR
ncbi:MAG: hypothetical protein JWN07_3189 [Hyphomicrobiales bacterium]|nr:hypothetical protein [Hyphomicrobiales bacterium]